MKKIKLIVGPYRTGKSTMAIELAEKEEGKLLTIPAFRTEEANLRSYAHHLGALIIEDVSKPEEINFWIAKWSVGFLTSFSKGKLPTSVIGTVQKPILIFVTQMESIIDCVNQDRCEIIRTEHEESKVYPG